MPFRRLVLVLAGAIVACTAAAYAQQPAPVVSPEVLPDGRVIFRILAPQAQQVRLNAGDIPASSLIPPGTAPLSPAVPGQPPQPAAPVPPVFVRNDRGVWETTVGPVPPGAFRYTFVVDGVRTVDPVNTYISESNTAAWSLFHVPGLDVQDTQNVPHGTVATVYYASSVLRATRRLHVYTPPGYEANTQRYPVFYLLHGASDTDHAWTSVGRAGFILDNLIASGKAVPMIVVMPAGHQPAPVAPPQPAATGAPASGIDAFTREFVEDVMPLVETRYRTITDRPHRAIAGLSMGGRQTLDIAFRHLDRFAYIGVFSSGAVLGGPRPGAAPAAVPDVARPGWETMHAANLGNAALKKGTKLIWLATGVDDRLMPNTRTTVDLLRKHGFEPIFKETPGGHTWLVWREYLVEFTPQLFR
jgi:enterochelin esterase family protein